MDEETKQIFFEFYNRFKESIYAAEIDMSHPQEERDELLINFASSLDNELKDYYSFTEEKIRKLWGVTFKERAIGFIGARKTDTQDEWLKPKVKKETLKEREKLMISERAVNYTWGQSKIKGVEKYFIKGEIDSEMMRAYDYLTRKLSNEWGSKKGSESKDIILFDSPENYFNFLANAELEKKPVVWKLELILSKVKDEMGYTSKEMSIEKLYKIFERLSTVFFGLKSVPILYNSEKKTWCKITLQSALFLLIPIELGIISNRWKTKDYKLKLRFSSEYPLGWLIIHNITCGKGGLITLPEKAYIGKDKLDNYGQNILREIRLGWRLKRLATDWAKIAGYKMINITDLIEAVVNQFENLKKKKYIIDFISEGKGSKIIIEPIPLKSLKLSK